jgi:hypothetical protein
MREYSPILMRFISGDPVWGVNLYAAYGNGPGNAVDPGGLRRRVILTMSYEEMDRRGLNTQSWYVFLFALWIKTPVEKYRELNAPYARDSREVIKAAGLQPAANYEIVQTDQTISWFYEDKGDFKKWDIPIYVIVMAHPKKSATCWG